MAAGVGGREKDVNKGGGLGPLYALPILLAVEALSSILCGAGQAKLSSPVTAMRWCGGLALDAGTQGPHLGPRS